VHGVVIATMADAAMGEAVGSTHGDEATPGTVEVTVADLNPGQSGSLTAAAEVRRGRVTVVEAEVTQDDDGTTVAPALATFVAMRVDHPSKCCTAGYRRHFNTRLPLQVLGGTRVSPGTATARLLAAVLVGGVVTTGCSPSTAPRTAGSPSGLPAAAATPTSAPTPAPAPPAPAPTDDGALPQTAASPAADTPLFAVRMAALWRAVVTGSSAAGLPAFFPLAAYRQVKTVSDPAGDWQRRLIGEFGLDEAVAHDLVGAQAKTATLLRVVVPAEHASWVPPGTCANRVGYWHVTGARVVYQVDGTERSFGIASLISWRGEWYVVHLGAVVRRSAGGVVDRPAAGPGVSEPQSGC
jgi:Thioesterase superfamily